MSKKVKVEQSWVLVGGSDGRLWWARPRRETRGDPASVAFADDFALRRHQERGDVVGFLHTHPGCPAFCSDRDLRTMRAWVSSLGRPLVCAIRGTDGLKAWRFADDEEPVPCRVRQAGSLVFGCFCSGEEDGR